MECIGLDSKDIDNDTLIKGIKPFCILCICYPSVENVVKLKTALESLKVIDCNYVSKNDELSKKSNSTAVKRNTIDDGSNSSDAHPSLPNGSHSPNGLQDPHDLSPLLACVAVPMCKIMCRPNQSESLHTECLKCLKTLLDRCSFFSTASLNGFIIVFTNVFLALADRKQPSKVGDVSEEVKLLTLEVMRSLLQATSNQVMEALLRPQQQMETRLGHAIYLCLQMAQLETNRQLRIRALEVVCLFGMLGRNIQFPAAALQQHHGRHCGDQGSGDSTCQPSADTPPPHCNGGQPVPEQSAQEDRTNAQIMPKATTEQDCNSRQKATKPAADGVEEPEHVTTKKTETNGQQNISKRNGINGRSVSNCAVEFVCVWKVYHQFCPGILTASSRIAMGDSNQGHRLTLAAIETLGHFVPLLLHNSLHCCGAAAAQQPTLLTSNMTHKKDVTVRTEEIRWVEEVRGKVVLVVQQTVRELLAHPHQVVRRTLALMLARILACCNKTVPQLLVSCVEGLAALAADHSTSVQEAASNALALAFCSCSQDLAHKTSQTRVSGSNCQQQQPLVVEFCSVRQLAAAAAAGGGAKVAACENCDGHHLPEDVSAVLQERVIHCFNRLPTLARGLDSERVGVVLRQLQGCLQLLGSDGCLQLLQLPGQLYRFLLSVAATVAYDHTDNGLMLQRAVANDCLSCPPPPCGVGRCRVYLQDSAQVAACGRVCALLAASGGPPSLLLADWLLLLTRHRHLAAELLSLLPAIIEGLIAADKKTDQSHSKFTADEKEYFVRDILEIVLTDDLLLAPLDLNSSSKWQQDAQDRSSGGSDEGFDEAFVASEDAEKPKSVADTLEHIYSRFKSPFNPCVNNTTSSSSNGAVVASTSSSSCSPSLLLAKQNVLVVSNSLLVVGSCARLMGPSFAMFLSRVMCALLEKCGERNVLVAHVAQQTLDSVGESCGFGDLHGLVEEAVPHFWFPLSMQLKRPQVYPRAPQILQVALECGGCNNRLSEFLQQLLQELLHCLDSHRSLAPGQLLALLRLYLANAEGAGVKVPASNNSKSGVGGGGEEKMGCNTTKKGSKAGDEKEAGNITRVSDDDGSGNRIPEARGEKGTGSRKKKKADNEESDKEDSDDDVGNNNGKVRAKTVMSRRLAGSEGTDSVNDNSVADAREISKNESKIRKADNECKPENDCKDDKITESNVSYENECNSVNEGGDIKKEYHNLHGSLLSKELSENEIKSRTKNNKDIVNEQNLIAPGGLTLFLQDYHENHVKQNDALQMEEAKIQKEMDKELQECGDGEGVGTKGFEEHVKSKDAENDHENDSSTNDNEDEPDAGESQSKEEVPANVQLLVDILERCCFLLHTRDRDISLILLDTIELGCQALKDWENSQLPVLHKVWKPLVLRIRDNDTIVMLRALTVCCVMVASSGDFLRKRCIKELLPAVNAFLTSQSFTSRGKTCSTGYLMTCAYLTQKNLLQRLYPELVLGLSLRSAEMIDVVRCLTCYLDQRQPTELLQASLGMLKTVAASHPQHVWLALGYLLKPTVLQPPAPGLHAIKLDGGVSRERRFLPPEVKLLHQQLC